MILFKEELIKDTTLRNKMGQSSRKLFKDNYSLKMCFEKLIKTIQTY